MEPSSSQQQQQQGSATASITTAIRIRPLNRSDGDRKGLGQFVFKDYGVKGKRERGRKLVRKRQMEGDIECNWMILNSYSQYLFPTIIRLSNYYNMNQSYLNKSYHVMHT